MQFMVLSAALIFVLKAGAVAGQAAEPVSFPLGDGFSDVIPRQIVRTADDRVYAFAVPAQYSTGIRAYWTTDPGLPDAGDFTGEAEVSAEAEPISVDAAYDGGRLIHVLANLRNGRLVDYVFDTAADTFLPPLTIGTDAATVEGDYIGTSGLSGMFDAEGRLHIAYWAAGDHIIHESYTYDSAAHALDEADAPTQLDSAGNANHPALAISPADGTITVAWISEARDPARILARTRSVEGDWGEEQVVSSAPPWTSRYFGVNIDQGPSLVIGADGTRHLAYIEDYDSSGEYGRVYYAVQSGGSGWNDEALALYSHDPAVAITGDDEVYIIGHGAESTGENHNMYTMKRSADETWDAPELFAAPEVSGDTFDSSPSVKWSVVGWNRAEIIEFVFFAAVDGNYATTTLYYGRLDIASAP